MIADELRLKFITIGDSGVGKTCLLSQYINEEYQNNLGPTVGVDVFNKELQHTSRKTNKTYKVHLQLWDTAGQERFRCLTNAFFRDAVGFILVFDLANESSFLHIRDWISDIQSNAAYEQKELILIGNKNDLENERIVSDYRAKQFARENQIHYIETSAAKNTNVIEAIELLLNLVIEQFEEKKIPYHQHKQTIKFSEEPKSNCCF